MATIAPGQTYWLSNEFLGGPFALASTQDNTNVFMEDADPLHKVNQQQWYLLPTEFTDYYSLHTLATGNDIALDVVNDNGVGSTNVHFTTAGDFSGQLWRFDTWDDGSVRVSNNFTGTGVYLDTYSDTLGLFLDNGDHTGQHWTFTSLNSIGTPTTSDSRTIPPAPVTPTTLTTTGTRGISASSVEAALSELQSQVPITAQQDSAAACFLLTSYSTCYPTPTWYTSLDGNAQGFFSSVNAANTAACTSCPSPSSHANKLSTGAEAGIGVGAVVGVAALIGIILGILKCMGIIVSGARARARAGAGGGAGARHAAGGWTGVAGDPLSDAHGWNGVAGSGGAAGGGPAPAMVEAVPFHAAAGFYGEQKKEGPNAAYQQYPSPQQQPMQGPGATADSFGPLKIDNTGMVYQQSRLPSEAGGSPMSHARSELESTPGGTTRSELSGDKSPSEVYGSPVLGTDGGEPDKVQVRNV